MIYKDGNKALVDRYVYRVHDTRLAASEIYRGDRLVWTAVRSCFGRGEWITEKPWLSRDSWKNNK